MSLFGSIMSKIFGNSASAASTPAAGTTASGTAGAMQGSMSGMPGTSANAAASAAAAPVTPGPNDIGGPAAAPMQSVDVAAVLEGMAAKHSEKLNWRTSIVDLMKLLDLDSSLSARKSLAQELHYSGSTEDSASMNMWLHKAVMQKLAENGGKVPADLKD